MTADCVHHWLLPTQSGPTALATCKHCGEQREFATGEVVKRWTMPPKDPTYLPDAQFRTAGKHTGDAHPLRRAKADTKYVLETDVDRS